MDELAKIVLPETSIDLPIIVGSEDERAIDIAALRAKTGYIALDPGYGNTGSCKSQVTFIDGEKGILRYRGIPIDQLGRNSSFLEVAYLLIYGALPDAATLDTFTMKVRRSAMLHEDLRHFFNGFPIDAHPMAILASVVSALATFEHEPNDHEPEVFDRHCIHLLAKLPTVVAYSYKKSKGHPFVYPTTAHGYVEDLIHMMFALPTEPYHVDPDFVDVLNLLFILHADHEQNCSTSTARMVRSSRASIYACISAAICALSGPRHGGANEEVINMLEDIRRDGGGVDKFVALAKDKSSSFRLMGFGHRVYRNYDPRASIIKEACYKLLRKLKIDDPLLDIAQALEEAALKDSYFVEKKLYPNVDFYSGILYRAMGFPVDAFTVMFALGRLPGWLAHIREYDSDPDNRLSRPRQVYTGAQETQYVEMADR